MTFVDLTKAFDTVSRTGLWKILSRLGCPPKFMKMITELHENQEGQVRLNGELSTPFPIRNGVKQGCVLAPTLFSLFFSSMLKQASKNLEDDEGVLLRYRTDGSLFNLRRLQARTKTKQQIVRELLFADDAALVAHTEEQLQKLTSCFARASELFGLEVSLKKTEVLHQPAPLEESQEPDININDYTLKNVNEFRYLGCTISNDAKLDKEIDNRLAKANSAFGRLRTRVWQNRNIKNTTKILLYRAVVLSTLLYGSESWVIYRRHLKLLERFHQRCLRSILRISWTDFVTNIDVLERSKMTSIEATLLKTHLRWAGHVARMDNTRLPKITLYSELSSGGRTVGAPKKRYKDQLKRHLKVAKINEANWFTLAADREGWRRTIIQASKEFEAHRRETIEEKRQARKNRQRAPRDAQPANPTLSCTRCGRTCLSRIGLISHQRACRA